MRGESSSTRCMVLKDGEEDRMGGCSSFLLLCMHASFPSLMYPSHREAN